MSRLRRRREPDLESRQGRSPAQTNDNLLVKTVDPGVESGASPTVEINGLSRWYGDVVAVSDVSFRLYPGVTGLLGPNGAGKSTIMKVMSGLLTPSTGNVRILGRNARADVSVYRHIGLVPEQETIYPYLTGWEFVRLNAILQHVPDIEGATESAIRTVELVDSSKRAIGGYSKGMRQRIKIAAALVHNPDILILDEPMTGTDPVQRAHLIELVRALGEQQKTVLVSSHVLHEVERFSDRIIVVVDGKLAAAGDYHAIRDKMDEHARTVRVRASDARGLASALIGRPETIGVRVLPDNEAIVIEARDVRALYRQLPSVARKLDIRLFEIAALDESLASVFAYVTQR